MSFQILRLPEVKARTGLARSTIYQLVHENKFPRPVALLSGSRAVGWLSDEIDAWIGQRIRASRERADTRAEK